MGKAILKDPNTGRVYLLEGGASLGRNSDNDIVLNDKAISGHHAQITNVGNTWYISDNKSTNGVEMNNFRIPSEGQLGLRDGCQLKLGNTVLDFSTNPEAIEKLIAARDNDRNTILINSSGLNNTRGNSDSNRTGTNSGRNKKSKKTLIVLIPVAAVIIAVLSWCMVNHINGGKNMAEGNYSAAISAYQKDFLFSRSDTIIAIMSAGEDAFSHGDYSEAGDYFLLAGEAGKIRRTDAVYERAKSLIADCQFDEAIAVLGEISDEERAKEQISNALYEKARGLIANLNYDEAITVLGEISDEERAKEQIAIAGLAKAKQQYSLGETKSAIDTILSIGDSKYVETASFLEELYRSYGDSQFLINHYPIAMYYYTKCVNDAEALMNAEILETLYNGELYTAAALADRSIKEETTNISREDWLAAFNFLVGEIDIADITLALNERASLALVKGITELDVDSIIDATPYGDMIGEYKSNYSNSYKFYIKDIDEFYAECGTAPEGKLLIIYQSHDYPDNDSDYAIAWNMMNLLPGELFPPSLSAVEYIVLVNYGYKVEGKYTIGAAALREYAEVTATRITDMRVLYKSQKQYGDHPPDSFSYYSGQYPLWKSGYAPNMGEELFAAISSVIK